MSYTTDMARLVEHQLSRFVSLNRHQLAGQVGNLDFWMEQVRHALQGIDGYRSRFERLTAAQEQYTERHQTIEYLHFDPCCTAGPAAKPRPVPHAELKDARRSLCEATYQFLARCCREQLLSEEAVRQICGEFDISVAAADLVPARK